MPRMRNGNSMSQTNGYSTSPSSASGQHRTNRMHQRKKAAITGSPDRRYVSADARVPASTLPTHTGAGNSTPAGIARIASVPIFVGIKLNGVPVTLQATHEIYFAG